jgi:ATP-dependent DNA helicase RecQ
VKRVVAMLHRLLEAGLARQRQPEGQKFMAVIELTAAGAAVMKGEAPPPLMLRDIAPSSSHSYSSTRANAKALAAQIDFDADPEVAARFARLRSLRTRLARERAVPPYVICHDSVLKLIAAAAPTSLEQLAQIKGMGPNKIAQFGDALLSALAERSSVTIADESQLAPDPFD